MKLEEFRLESYDERLLLMQALAHYRHMDPNDPYQVAIEALFKRLVATECQPGGCSYCNPDLKEEWS
jgi:hypothetical protein